MQAIVDEQSGARDLNRGGPAGGNSPVRGLFEDRIQRV